MGTSNETTLAEQICSLASDDPQTFESNHKLKSIVERAKKEYQIELRSSFDKWCLSVHSKKCIDKAVRYDLDAEFINEMRSDFVSEYGRPDHTEEV